MIQQTDSSWQITTAEIEKQDEKLSWQQLLINSFRQPEQLLAFLQIDAAQLGQNQHIDKHSDFPFLVPRPFAELMKKGDAQDPLLRQVLSITTENQLSPNGYSHDPVGEEATNVVAGLVHKYHGRVLLLVSGHCAVNCRYCFRRHFPYQENQLSKDQWQAVLTSIAEQPDISEVILSGGDPLSAPDRFLQWLTNELAAIPTVHRLRIHSRLPVVIPQRINDHSMQWLQQERLKVSFVLHINHANEISLLLRKKIQLMREAGIHVFNQSVLLAGVNDDSEILTKLCFDLFDAGVIPYYIHLLDKVQGAAHFEVSAEKIAAIKLQLWQQLPGYILPRIVRENSGLAGKTII